jgi:aminomethyltransferase
MSANDAAAAAEPKKTPLYDLHHELGGKVVDFAGWALPVQYPTGIKAEHLHCRAQAGLFDVSHMGQVRLVGESAAADFETLVPGNLQGLAAGKARYTMFTNEAGGILDDLIVSNAGDHLLAVVNASCRDADIARLRARLEPAVTVEELTERAMLALQGPAAAAALARLAPASEELSFMSTAEMAVDGLACRVSRLGYTGEDGFEISVAAEDAEALARSLLAQPEVAPIGLGARDSLRLEAGLCLYGNDIDSTTTPIEAQLQWSIGKRRRDEGGYPGAAIIAAQLAEGPRRKLVGIRPDGPAPAREQTEIQNDAGQAIGVVTSGGFGPSVGGPVAMGYVDSAYAAPDTALQLIVRGKSRPARVAALPFTPHRYRR